MKYSIIGWVLTVGLLVAGHTMAQEQREGIYDPSVFDKKYGGLLNHPGVQLESAEAIGQLYNYKFYDADEQFRWLQHRYPHHPMPYFLRALAEWWKIVPNTDVTDYDDRCLSLLDSTIRIGEELYDNSSNKLEPAFFLSAAYAFKGRLFAERKKYAKATLAGKSSLKYFRQCKGNADFSPELLFGDGLYNYYAQWIRENYPLLKPLMVFFPKGDKALGIKQLEKTANTAYYTRVEARYFLLQIYNIENQHMKAYELAKFMHEQYPDNPYFERYYLRSAFVIGRAAEAETLAKDILAKIAKSQSGYEGVSGRTAAYILGYINQLYRHDLAAAKTYYNQAIAFVKQTNSYDAGYYWSSVLGLGNIAAEEKDYDQANAYFKEVMDKADRKSSQFKEARKALDDSQKNRRQQRRQQKA